MTQYLGNVLAARSGLKDPRRSTATSSPCPPRSSTSKVGREWRPTEDTAVSASLIRGGNQAWVNWRRSQDYYQEGELLWLDADTTIRKLTNNQKSLDDFEKIFLGKGGNTGPLIVTYDRAELIRDLNQVVPYDWTNFLHERIDNINPRADLAGIEQGGYRLIFTDKPNASEKTMSDSGSRRARSIDVWYSLGLSITDQGLIQDVRWGSPADKARLAPGEHLLAINGQVFTPDLLKSTVKDSKSTSGPLHLTLQSDTFLEPPISTTTTAPATPASNASPTPPTT